MKKHFNKLKETLARKSAAVISAPASRRGLVCVIAAVSATITGFAIRARMRAKTGAVKNVLANNSGEGYVDTAVKILMAVVIGALVLAGLYALFGDTVMPTLTRKIQEMFNYNG